MNKELRILFFLILAALFFGGLIQKIDAATNISSNASEHWAWNDVIGWIDFNFDDVYVTSQKIEGYASSSVGYIAFDCATSPTPNCTFPYKITNDGSGNLSGWAWSDAIGWISFDCHNSGGNCISSNYQVKINPTGRFSGWAWNDIVGWISFNCSDAGICGTSDYKVYTLWVATAATSTLLSSIFDTGVAGGAAFNSIMWQGSQPAGTVVRFQFASSASSTGPWLYRGPDGSDATFYMPTGSGLPIPLNRSYHNNHRYYRYKIILESDVSQTVSPRVDNVIVNWSP